MSGSPKQAWDEYAIKAEIYRRGETLTTLGDKLGYAPASIRGAFMQPSGRVCRAIARYLDAPVQELWPDWFDCHGELIPRRQRQASKKKAAKASQTSHAA